MSKAYYRIALLDIKLDLKDLNPIYLFNFIPFRIEEEIVSTLLFSVSYQDLNDVIEIPTRQYKIGDSIIYIYLLKKRACYIKIYSEVTEKEYLFKPDYQWAEIKTNLKFINQVEYTILSHAIMFMFIYSSSFYNTVFFDASSVMIDKEGIAFL